ncbi:hypothetical protein AVEN_273542-1 [Araneus ventricosus]|uniref:Uncharacterized protein n=1 Tax=Araneus ventricosus TaxID=182803 RepID=A0A4Y2H535_ARAVE|nr:hypothetical protein AVEN_273542-1 [Araneus ventricosus]
MSSKEVRDLIHIINLEKEKRRINEERRIESITLKKQDFPEIASEKQEIRDLKHINKLEKEKRRINEEKIEDQLGVERSLKRFHKPVLEEIKKQDTTRKQQIQAIQNLADNLSIIPQHESSKLLEIEPDYSSDATNMFDSAEGIVRYYLNKHLDTNFIKNEGFDLPTELINKTKDELDKIIKSAKERRQHYILRKANSTKHAKKDEIKDADYKMKMMNEYIEVLTVIKQSEKYIGEGLDDKLKVLDKLTDKICQSKKSIPLRIYNQVVILLDRLFKEGIMTNDQVKQYYHNFLI